MPVGKHPPLSNKQPNGAGKYNVKKQRNKCKSPRTKITGGDSHNKNKSLKYSEGISKEKRKGKPEIREGRTMPVQKGWAEG